MAEFLAILALATGCYLLRVLFVVVVPADVLPASARRALDHLPPAMLSALVTVSVVNGVTAGSGRLDVVVAVGLVAVVALVAATTRSVGWSVAAAVAMVALLDVLVGMPSA